MQITLVEPSQLAKAQNGSEHMTSKPEFCRYPGGTEGCRRSLILACSKGSVDKHCIFEGLRADWHQCRQVLLEGLKSKNLDLHEPCKQVVLLGYPSKIKALEEVFYEAYYSLVRTIIHRLGIKDDGQPSADDVSQQVFANLLECFRKEASVKVPLGVYIARATVHECFRQLKEAHRYISLPENELQIQTSLLTALLPPSVVECWEDMDQRLHCSKQGDLINRTILAQQCLEACSTGKKPSAKQLMADWQSLVKMPRQDIAALHKKIVTRAKHSPGTSAIHIAADLINKGIARPYQLAIVFAAGTGMDREQIEKLIAQISNLSATAVYARICRIYTVPMPPWTQENDDET